VRSLGDEPRSYFGSNQTFIGASGWELAPSSSADMWMNTTDLMGDINLGNSIQVKVAVDVPPGAPTEGASAGDARLDALRRRSGPTRRAIRLRWLRG
jgi:hypothetical protein